MLLPRSNPNPTGWIGVDINCDSIAHGSVAVKGGEPDIVHFGKDSFPPSGPAGERLTKLHEIINELVEEAARDGYGICLEYLDFEHCKRWLKNKLGALRHVIPYRSICGIFERRCLELGVPLRCIPPKYSSILGALISERWPQIGRDQAAGVVLALRASEAGNQWLERACEQAVKAQRFSLRLNAKGKYGHNLVVEDSPPQPTSKADIGRQMGSPRFPVEPALNWQVACGRKVSRVYSTLADQKSAWLRVARRAAKAQKRSFVLPRFKMPSRLNLDTPIEANVSSECSSLRRVA